MIKSFNDELYNRLKNNVGFHRSKKFLAWFHKEFPGMIQHHVFGSTSQSLKTSDYCSLPVTAFEHEIAEKDKSNFAIDRLPDMIYVMQTYIRFLEGEKK